jgi:uncharacterized protein (TIGR02452 family)
MNRGQRTQVAKQTLAIIEQGFYDTATGRRIDLKDPLEKSIAGSKLYAPQDFAALELPSVKAGDVSAGTRFRVVNTTTLDAAHDMFVEDNGKVLCLNFASAKNPGGGFLNGSQAQEESLARSSCLYPTLLKQETYYKMNRACGTCLYTDYMIYSPDVLVIRRDDGELLEEPFSVSFVTAPAVNAGAVKRNEPFNIERIIPVMAQRMQHLLTLCAHQGYQHLVLGAWGCGVFMNDPSTIADLWYTLLVENGVFHNRFNTVVFAVLDRHDHGTISAFEARFKPLLN